MEWSVAAGVPASAVAVATAQLDRRGWRTAADVRLAMDPDLGAETFRIAAAGDGVCVSGGDGPGLLFGIGKLLRTGAAVGGVFRPGAWRGTSAPRKPWRCVYFATHFHNWYHEAPVAAIAAYVEELALWGFNAIAVWPDKHHYAGAADPEWQAFLERLRQVFAAARRLGMRVVLCSLANEGFSSTPEALRGQPTGRAWYGCEICPRTAAGMDLILANHRHTLEYFADVGVDDYIVWPYDQGGCGCPDCRPWGANGMLAVGRRVAGLLHELHPGARLVYSTWLFDWGEDAGEWARFADRLAAGDGDWIDVLMIDSHTDFPRYPLEHGIPGGLPALNFPEISMRDIHPWGGSGANPMPAVYADLWGQAEARCAGGMLYSEGIFEDLNKALYAGFYWRGDNDIHETIRDYAAYELGLPPETHADFHELLAILEANRAFGMRREQAGEGYRRISYCGRPAWLRHHCPRDPGAALALVDRLADRLPAWARAAWRWRLLELRVRIDAELAAHDGDVSEHCADLFEELRELYHADEVRTYAAVCPPTRRVIFGPPPTP